MFLSIKLLLLKLGFIPQIGKATYYNKLHHHSQSKASRCMADPLESPILSHHQASLNEEGLESTQLFLQPFASIQDL